MNWNAFRKIGVFFQIVSAWVLWVCLVMMLSVRGVAAGEHSGTDRDVRLLTLQQSIRLALQNHPGFQASRHATRAASWRVKQAYFDFLPKLAIDFNYNRLDAETVHRANIFTEIGRALVRQFAPDEDPNEIRPAAWRNAYGTSVILQQPIFNGGALKAQLDMALAAEDNARSNFTDKRQQVIYETMEAYLEAVKGEEFLALAQKALQAAANRLQQIQRMFENGLRNRAEVLRWEVEAATAEGDFIEARNQLLLARMRLSQLTGVHIDSTVKLSHENLPTPERLQPVEHYLELARQKNPRLRAFQANISIQRAQIHLARSNFFPRINLVYSYQWEANNTIALDSYKTWNLGIGVHVPLFNSFSDYARVQEARMRLRELEASRVELEQQLSLQIRQAHAIVQAARKRWQVAQKQLELARRNLESVSNSFQVGMAANMDLLDAQVAATRAEANLIRARFDYLLAYARLRHAAGILETQEF